MQRYFMNLAYLGRNFHGWQRQPNASSVQEALENAISTVLRSPVPIVGAGRTDTGVNASTMIAHFDLEDAIDDSKNLVRAINSITGPQIAVRWIREVHPEAHARFDATSRTYHYYAHTGRNPFSEGLSWEAPANLDFEAMNEAAKKLLTTSDFTSFAKLHTDVKTNICSVTRAEWVKDGADGMTFVITADRFLRNMVRAVVGTLVDVGRGRLSCDDFKGIIEARDRCAAGTSMPPEALFLWDITYPYYRPADCMYEL